MEKKEKEKILPQERYDKKLFKQAVKAAQAAKLVEEKQKRRRKAKKSLLIFLLLLLICFGIYLVLPFFEPKQEYTVAIKHPTSLMYEEIQEHILNEYSDDTLALSNLQAESVIVFNPLNGEVLFEKESNEKRNIASLTKLISAIITLENFDLDDVITVSLENIPEDLHLQLGVKDGDSISVENILKAMLVSSYNDSAYIIANAYPYGGYEGFVKAMNRKTEMLRMKNTSFSNPAGLDQEGNYSSAFDMGILSSVSRKYPEILSIVDSEKEIVSWSTQNGLLSTEVVSTNKVINEIKYIKGLKTGNTDLAGECFIGYFLYPSGNELITVVLNSQDRFGDTTIIERYARQVLLK